MAKQTSFTLQITALGGIVYRTAWFDAQGYKKVTIQSAFPVGATMAVGQTSVLQSYLGAGGQNAPITGVNPFPTSTTLTPLPDFTIGQTLDICSGYINLIYLSSVGSSFQATITLED